MDFPNTCFVYEKESESTAGTRVECCTSGEVQMEGKKKRWKCGEAVCERLKIAGAVGARGNMTHVTSDDGEEKKKRREKEEVKEEETNHNRSSIESKQKGLMASGAGCCVIPSSLEACGAMHRYFFWYSVALSSSPAATEAWAAQTPCRSLFFLYPTPLLLISSAAPRRQRCRAWARRVLFFLHLLSLFSIVITTLTKAPRSGKLVARALHAYAKKAPAKCYGKHESHQNSRQSLKV